MCPGLQVIDSWRWFAADGMSQLCSTFAAGLGSAADATSALTDPEPVIAACAEIDAADTITKPEMMATEAVLKIFIFLPPNPCGWAALLSAVQDAPVYVVTEMFPVMGQKLQPNSSAQSEEHQPAATSCLGYYPFIGESHESNGTSENQRTIKSSLLIAADR
jgi:hypothetical protein